MLSILLFVRLSLIAVSISVRLSRVRASRNHAITTNPAAPGGTVWLQSAVLV
jgi:hypothetical protein